MFAVNFAILLSLSLASAASRVPRISNGNDAEITEFPFLVSIQQINVCMKLMAQVLMAFIKTFHVAIGSRLWGLPVE